MPFLTAAVLVRAVYLGPVGADIWSKIRPAAMQVKDTLLDDLQALQVACSREKNELLEARDGLTAAGVRVEQLTRDLAHSRAEAAWLRGAVKASQDQFATEVRSRRYIETSGR